MRTTEGPAPAGALTIGKLARCAQVSADTVRFYERAGLLRQVHRSPAGYRLYDQSDIDRVKFIRRAKDLGFSLEEVGQLLALGDDATSGTIRNVAEKHLAQVEARLGEMTRVRDALKSLVQTCQGDVPARECPVLRALVPEQ